MTKLTNPSARQLKNIAAEEAAAAAAAAAAKKKTTKKTPKETK